MQKKFGDFDSDAFQRETNRRLVEKRHASELEQQGGKRAARVAIVGAGPTGLWLANLLCREHATIYVGSTGTSIARKSTAPTVDVFERRAPTKPSPPPAPAPGPVDVDPTPGTGAGAGADAASDLAVSAAAVPSHYSGESGVTSGVAAGPMGSGVGGRVRGYGTRKVVLAISSATQDLLNRNLTSSTKVASDHRFAPACSINLIESVLQTEFQRYVDAGFGTVTFGEAIADPDSLFAEGYDVVIVASGRHALGPEWRVPRGLPMAVTGAEHAVIFRFAGGLEAGKATSAAELVLAKVCGNTKLHGKSARGFLRPGAAPGTGWIWLLGLPAAVLAAVATGAGDRLASFGAALAACGADTGDHMAAEAAAGLDAALKPAEVSVQVTEASYWASADVACRSATDCDYADSADSDLRAATATAAADADAADALASRCQLFPMHDDAGVPDEPAAGSACRLGWTVLVGDAACGRPFFLGSTLNGHLHDLVTLAQGTNWSAWDPDVAEPFRKYRERIRLRTNRMPSSSAGGVAAGVSASTGAVSAKSP